MLIDLGWCMARLTKGDDGCSRLLIVSPQDGSEVNGDAQSVVIYSDTSLIALRDALNQAWPVDQKVREEVT